MSRGLRWFVIFCAALGAGLAVIALYLGPNVLAFLFHSERSSAPFVIVRFVDFADGGNAQDLEEYTSAATEVVTAAGGRPLWQGRVRRVLEGRPDDLWDAVILVDYPSRDAFINLVTSSSYRKVNAARSENVRRSALLAATPVAGFASNFSDEGHRSCALLLHRFVDEDARAAYYEKYLPAQLESAQNAGAIVMWRGSANPLFADRNFAWTDLILLGFESEAQLSAWAYHPVWRSRQALARPLMLRWALVEVEPRTPMP